MTSNCEVSNLPIPNNTDPFSSSSPNLAVTSNLNPLPPVRYKSRNNFQLLNGQLMATVNEDPISLWLKEGELDKLEQAVLDGYGQHLNGKTSRIPHVCRFLKQVPTFQAKIEEIHRAVTLGKLRNVQHLIDRKKFAFCRDQMGATPLHKAVIYAQKDIINYLLERYPTAIHARDHRGRTVLHYAAVIPDGGDIYKHLMEVGADQNATDMFGKKPEHYLQSKNEISAQVLREGAIVSKPIRYPKMPNNNDTSSTKFYTTRALLHRSNIKELIKQGNLSTLEEVVLQGYGDRLIGETSSAPLVQEFLDRIPSYIDQITELHRATIKGNLREFQSLLDRKSMILAKDQIGATPLHKAILYGNHELAEYIATNFPVTLDARDNDGRTPLHYAAALDDDRNFYNMLIKSGASPMIPDFRGHTADFYLRFPDQINLQHIMKRSQRLNANYAINTANRVKTKSPSRIKERNISPSNLKRDSNHKTNDDRQNEEILSDKDSSSVDGSHVSNQSLYRKMYPHDISHRIEVTSANLKRWMQDDDIVMLEGAVIEGHGDIIKTKSEHITEAGESAQMYVTETVPKIMDKIRIIHAAVANGDLIGLQDNLDKKDYVLSKDHFGMAPLHKATILGHMDVVQYILEKFPETVNSRDKDGRTALHYAAATTNRNGSKIYKMLIRSGADSRIKDLIGKSAEYYRVHRISLPSELSKTNNRKKNQINSNESSNTRRRTILLPSLQEKITSALHDGDTKQLLELVLDGYGDALFGRASWGEDARKFLKGLPHLMDNIKSLHATIINGDVENVKRILNNDPNLIRAKDENGLYPIHLSVLHNHPDIVDYFIEKFPASVHFKDNNGRTPLHIAAQNKLIDIYRKLIDSGGDPKTLDLRGRTADHYLRAQTLQNYDLISPSVGEYKKINDDNPHVDRRIPSPLKERNAKGKASKKIKDDTKTKLPSVSDDNYDNINSETQSEKTDSIEPSDNQSPTQVTIPSRLPSPVNGNADDTFSYVNGDTTADSKETTNDETGDDTLKAEETYTETTDETTAAGDNADEIRDDLALNEDREQTQEYNTGDLENPDAEENNNEQSTEQANIETEEREENREDIIPEDSVENSETIQRDDAPNEEIKEQIQINDEPPENTEDNHDRLSERVQQHDNTIQYQQSQASQDDRPLSGAALNGDVSANIGTDDHVEVNDAEHLEADMPIIAEESETTDVINETLNNNQSEEPQLNEECNQIDGKDIDMDKNIDEDWDKDVDIDVGEDVNKTVNEDVDETVNEDVDESEDVDKDVVKDIETDVNDDNVKDVIRDIETDIDEDKDMGTEVDKEIGTDIEVKNMDKFDNDINIDNDDGIDNIGEDVNENVDIDIGEDFDKDGYLKIGEGMDKDVDIEIGENVDKDVDLKISEDMNKDVDIEISEDMTKNVDEDAEKVLGESVEKDMDLGVGANVDEDMDKDNGTDVNNKIMDDVDNDRDINKDMDNTLINGETIENDEFNTLESQTVITETVLAEVHNDPSGDVPDGGGVLTPELNDRQSISDEKHDELINESEEIESQNPDDNGSVQPKEEDAVSQVQGNGDATAEENAEEERAFQEEDINQTKESIGEDANGGTTNGDTVNGDTVNGVDEAVDDTERNESEKNEETNDNDKEDREKSINNSHESIIQMKGTINEETTDGKVNGNIETKNGINIDGEENNYEMGTETDVDILNDDVNDKEIDANGTENIVNEDTQDLQNLEKRKSFTAPEERTLSQQSISPHSYDDRLGELIDHWIEANDLLRLEHVIIAGQGDRLFGRKSDNKQVQDFLELVPAYMAKIKSIHDTVIRGNINEVKHVLTRKRFALSRDHIGASPLHLAVLHGHTDVMVFIMAQFPETIDGPDNEGRTPLHYAAVVGDPQKQYYRILETAGANPSLKDKNGRTPEYYLTHSDELTIRSLLENYKQYPESRQEGSAEIWQRPPTADIESRLTPTPDDSGETNDFTNNANRMHLHQLNTDADIHNNGDAKKSSLLSNTRSLNRSLSQTSRRDGSFEERDFHEISDEFKKNLKEEKLRLQKTFDSQMSTADSDIPLEVSIIDTVQTDVEDFGSTIMNGESASGYDLIQIKDENGQTVLHLAAAKSQKRKTFYNMLSQAEYLIHERDAQYRTIREVSVQNGIKDNLQVIDQYILDAFANENVEFIRNMCQEGYDNLLTIVDSEGSDVTTLLKRKDLTSMISFLHDLAQFQKTRDELHAFVKHGYIEGLTTLVDNDPTLITAKNNKSRCAMHIAVLFGNIDIIITLIERNKSAVNTPDNMGRTSLHYAMAGSRVEDIGPILLKAGANKALRDVKMRTPAYYYLYKQEIYNIKKEETESN